MRDPGASEPLAPVAAAAFRLLVDGGAATRPELSVALGVTKQTVSSAIAQLERRGLAAPVAVQQGPAGRSALRYGLGPDAGWVAGVDLGATVVRVAAARLDGIVIAERTVTRPGRAAGRSWPDAALVAADAVRALGEELSGAAGPLLGVAAAVGGPVAAVDQPDRSASALGPLTTVGVPVWTENDVNCAALAQLRYRTIPLPDSVLHVRVGTGVGAALIVSGEVVRGARGRAGEVAGLPAPLPGRGATVETALGARGLLAAAGHSTGADLTTAVDDLIESAEAGDDAALAALEQEARGIALLLRTLVAMVDPEAIVLSGRIGGSTRMRRTVAQELERLGVTAPLLADPLGEGATVLGAVHVAVGQVLAALTGR